MKFEQPPTPSPEEGEKKEKERIQLSQEQYDILANRHADDPELLNLMKEKGISFDSGAIEIEIDGKGEIMTTAKDDFGTLKMSEEAIAEVEKRLRDTEKETE